MIYIIWSMGEELEPSLEAFKSKEKALKHLAKHEEERKKCERHFRVYKCGMYVVPHAKSQLQMARNISRHCL